MTVNSESTVAAIKDALKAADIAFPAKAKKADLLALLPANVVEEPEPAPAPAEEPVAEEPEVLYYETIDFPGNYSIVTAPLALEIAAAAGVPAKSENVKGRLNRIVSFGGDDMDKAQKVAALVKETVAQALADLKVWQKENVEKRKGLTDMQRYVQNREFIAAAGTKVAKKVKKDGV